MKIERDELFPDTYITNEAWENGRIHYNEISKKFHVIVNREFTDGEYDHFEEAVKALEALCIK